MVKPNSADIEQINYFMDIIIIVIIQCTVQRAKIETTLDGILRTAKTVSYISKNE